MALRLNPQTGQWEESPDAVQQQPQVAPPQAQQQPLIGPDPARDQLLQALAGRYSVPPNRVATQGHFKSDAMSGEDWAKTFGSGGPSHVNFTPSQQAGLMGNFNVNTPEVREAGAILASPPPVATPNGTNQTGAGIDYNAIAARRADAEKVRLGAGRGSAMPATGLNTQDVGSLMASMEPAEGWPKAGVIQGPATATSAPLPSAASLPNHDPSNPVAPKTLGEALAVLPGSAQPQFASPGAPAPVAPPPTPAAPQQPESSTGGMFAPRFPGDPRFEGMRQFLKFWPNFAR